MPIDTERLRLIAENVFRRFPHQVEGRQTAMSDYGGRQRPYQMFRLRLVDFGPDSDASDQYTIEAAVLGALESFFDDSRVGAEGDDLLVWRSKLEFNNRTYAADDAHEGALVIHIVTLRMRCHTMKVVDALRVPRESSGIVAETSVGVTSLGSAGHETVLQVRENPIRAAADSEGGRTNTAIPDEGRGMFVPRGLDPRVSGGRLGPTEGSF